MVSSSEEVDLELFEKNYDMNSPVLAKHWEEVVDHLHGSCPIARSEVGEATGC